MEYMVGLMVQIDTFHEQGRLMITCSYISSSFQEHPASRKPSAASEHPETRPTSFKRTINNPGSSTHGNVNATKHGVHRRVPSEAGEE